MIPFSTTLVVESISSKLSQGLPGSIKGFLFYLAFCGALAVFGGSGLTKERLSELLTLNNRAITF